MSQDVSKIGSVTEKGFNKQEKFDLENPDKELKSPQDADEFSNLLDGQSGFENESQIAINNEAVQLKESPANVGDKILNAFQGVKDSIDTQHTKVDQLLNKDEALSMRDMFKTQKAMSNLMMTQDLIGKVVGKSTQSLETLMKQQ